MKSFKRHLALLFALIGVLASSFTVLSPANAGGVSYTVTYHYNSADTGNSKVSDSFTGTAVTLPAPGKTGFVFAGWYDDAGLTDPSIGGAGDPYTPAASGGAWAKWESCADYLGALTKPASTGVATWASNAISSLTDTLTAIVATTRPN